MKELIVTIDTLDNTVSLYQTGVGAFEVIYGKQIKSNLSYLKAAEEFGLCVIHSAQCGGFIEDDVWVR